MKPHPFLQRIEQAELVAAEGALIAMSGNYLEADGPTASVGDYCEIAELETGETTIAEVVAVGARSIRLLPLTASRSFLRGSPVRRLPGAGGISVGEGFAGRAVGGLGQPIDNGPAIWASEYVSREGRVLPTLARISPREIFTTGIRAIDTLLPLGKGQRIGIFAASGVGKTSLIEQIATQAQCDRLILCLVGERGREVDRFWSMIGTATGGGMRSTLIAATADESPSLRLRAIDQALALAEYWRDAGEHVLLIVDSVTRAAHALREIGLAAGLPPAMRGLTPNVFSALPRLVERCGAARDGGTITAVLTVLSETDEVDDPVVELMKSVLDGHIVLSRTLAERRHFPAIDVRRSISRLAGDLLGPNQLGLMQAAHTSIACFEEARLMIESGLYREGSNPEIDRAIRLQPHLAEFLKQAAGQDQSRRDPQSWLNEIMAERADG